MNNIRIAKQLVRLAKQLLGSKSRTASNVTVEQVAKLLMESIKNFNTYYYMQLPSGRWLCMQGEQQDGVKYNKLYINTRVDDMGQPYGLLCVDLGSVSQNDTMDYCVDMAKDILEEDNSFSYEFDSIWPITAENFYKEYMEAQRCKFDFQNWYIIQNHKDEFMDLVNQIGGNVYDAIDKAGDEIIEKYSDEQ